MHRDLSPDFERFVLERSTMLLRTAVLLVGDLGHAEEPRATWRSSWP
jgi:hypothetical protein